MNGFVDGKDGQGLLQREFQYDDDITEAISLLTSKYSYTPAACPNIESFALYKAMNLEGVIATYQSGSAEPPLCIYLVSYSKSQGTFYIIRNYRQVFLGLLLLQREYPRTCILKETLQTRINDWFVKEDVDFDNQKKFSKQFHVVSNDKASLELLLKDKPLDLLADFPEMEAELFGKRCLLKISNDPGSAYDVERLLELSNKVYHVLSGSGTV